MIKADVYLIIGSIYLAISLIDKPVILGILSLCYLVLSISMGN